MTTLELIHLGLNAAIAFAAGLCLPYQIRDGRPLSALVGVTLMLLCLTEAVSVLLSLHLTTPHWWDYPLNAGVLALLLTQTPWRGLIAKGWGWLRGRLPI